MENMKISSRTNACLLPRSSQPALAAPIPSCTVIQRAGGRKGSTNCGDEDHFLIKSRVEVDAARRLLDGIHSSSSAAAAAAYAAAAGPTVIAADTTTDRRRTRIVGITADAVDSQSRCRRSESAGHDVDADDPETGPYRRSEFFGLTADTARVSSTDKSCRKPAAATAVAAAAAGKTIPFSAAASADSRFPASTRMEKVGSGSRSGSTVARSPLSKGRDIADAPSGRTCLVDDEAGDFYRAALSTHISFIATTPADDPASSRSLQIGGAFREAGGVGEACRALHGDVAGVRQVRAGGG